MKKIAIYGQSYSLSSEKEIQMGNPWSWPALFNQKVKDQITGNESTGCVSGD